MFKKLTIIAIDLIVCLTQGCQSSPEMQSKDVQGAEYTLEQPEGMDSDSNFNSESEPESCESFDSISTGLDEDLGFLGKSKTPVSNGIFWTSTLVVGSPLFILAFPIQQLGDLPKEIYAPGFIVGKVGGGAIVAPFYLVEKSYVTTKKNFSRSGS